MRLVLDVAGGFAPSVMGRRFVVEVDELSAAQRATLTAAVEAARQYQAPSPNPAARDVRSYEIRIAETTGETTLVAFDGAITPAVRALIDLITLIAQEQGRQ
jgi:hypothetical protein